MKWIIKFGKKGLGNRALGVAPFYDMSTDLQGRSEGLLNPVRPIVISRYSSV